MASSEYERSTIRPNPRAAPKYITPYKFPQFQLTTLDIVAQNTYDDRTVVLYFAGDPVDTKRFGEALGLALGNYPILAGRLAKDAQGRLCVSVNDAGATLSIAHTYIPDEQLLQGTNGVHSVCTSKNEDHMERVPKVNQEHPDPDQPLCTVKLTRFRSVHSSSVPSSPRAPMSAASSFIRSLNLLNTPASPRKGGSAPSGLGSSLSSGSDSEEDKSSRVTPKATGAGTPANGRKSGKHRNTTDMNRATTDLIDSDQDELRVPNKTSQKGLPTPPTFIGTTDRTGLEANHTTADDTHIDSATHPAAHRDHANHSATNTPLNGSTGVVAGGDRSPSKIGTPVSPPKRSILGSLKTLTTSPGLSTASHATPTKRERIKVGTVATEQLEATDTDSGSDADPDAHAPAMPTCALAVSVSSCLVDMDSLHTFIGCLVQHYNNGTVDAKSLDRCQPLTDLSTRSQSAKSFDITNPPKGYYVEPKGFVSHIITRYRTSALESAVFRIAITHSVRARQMARKHITAALASCVWNILTDLKEAMRLSSHKSSSERIAHPPLATRQSSSFAIKHEKMRLYLPINLRHTQCISPDFFGNAEIQTMVELPTDSLLSASQCSMEDVADAIELHAITQQQRSAVQDVLDWLQGAERRDKGIMLDYRGSTGASFLTVQVSDKDWYNGLEFGSSGIPVFASIPSGKTGWHAQTIRANEEEFDLFVTLPRPAMEVMVQEWSQALLSEAEKQSS